MTDLWIVIIEDRHTDVEALPFSDEVTAVAAACAYAESYEGVEEALTPRMQEDGWVFLAAYGTEGDCVRVVKRVLDG